MSIDKTNALLTWMSDHASGSHSTLIEMRATPASECRARERENKKKKENKEREREREAGGEAQTEREKKKRGREREERERERERDESCAAVKGFAQVSQHVTKTCTVASWSLPCAPGEFCSLSLSLSLSSSSSLFLSLPPLTPLSLSALRNAEGGSVPLPGTAAAEFDDCACWQSCKPYLM